MIYLADKLMMSAIAKKKRALRVEREKKNLVGFLI
jgi:hypothetical protein